MVGTAQGSEVRTQDGFIAVDWGTTNRRAYRIGTDGQITASFEDARGVMTVAEGGFPLAIAELRARLGDGPMLLDGMVGSNRSRVDVPYVSAPTRLTEHAAGVCWVEPGAVAIVPGVSIDDAGRADVMRGEEVQALGAVAAGRIAADALVCPPAPTPSGSR